MGASSDKVIIKDVLYSPRARTTLISLAALRKAGLVFAYDVGEDCFIINDQQSHRLFTCPFDWRKNRRCITNKLVKIAPAPVPPSSPCTPSPPHVPTAPICNTTQT